MGKSQVRQCSEAQALGTGLSLQVCAFLGPSKPLPCSDISFPVNPHRSPTGPRSHLSLPPWLSECLTLFLPVIA